MNFAGTHRNSIREGSRIADGAIYAAALLIAFVTLYPMYYVLILSLSAPEYASTMQVYWLPKGFYLGGYKKIFGDIRLWTSYRNTIFYALYVILPVAKPIIAVIALYTIVGVWNSWFNAALYLADQNIQPLQLYLRRVLVTSEIDLVVDLTTAEEIRAAQANLLSDSQLKYTVIIVASLPMLLAYPFFQKYFVKGVMLGSLKE